VFILFFKVSIGEKGCGRKERKDKKADSFHNLLLAVIKEPKTDCDRDEKDEAYGTFKFGHNNRSGESGLIRRFEKTNDVKVFLCLSTIKSRSSPFVADVGVGTRIKERSDELDVAFVGGPYECGITIVILNIDAGTGLYEQVHRLWMTLFRGSHQGGVSVFVLGVHMGTGGYESLDNYSVALLRRPDQGGEP